MEDDPDYQEPSVDARLSSYKSNPHVPGDGWASKVFVVLRPGWKSLARSTLNLQEVSGALGDLGTLPVLSAICSLCSFYSSSLCLSTSTPLFCLYSRITSDMKKTTEIS
jgi:hypothetical protein